jgi:putative transcriptional regulator
MTRKDQLVFINKPLKYTIHDLIPEINANSKSLTEAQSNRTTSTSSIIDLIPNSIEISNGIYWGGDFECTKELINNGKIGKQNVRFFLDILAGEQQLESEMNEKCCCPKQL